MTVTAPHLDPQIIAIGERALGDMCEVAPSLVYAVLLTDDGFEIVSVRDAGIDGGRFASMSSSTQALSDAVVRELSVGSNEYVIIAAERGNLIQLRIPGQPIVLAALFDRHETLGKALSASRVTAKHLAVLLAAAD